MPWREASPMDQRTPFIADHLRDALSITELCALYCVSRKDGLQMDRSLSALWAIGSRGALAAAGALAESDGRRDCERDPGRPMPAPTLGRQKAPGAAAQAASAVESPRPLHGMRYPQAARAGADQTPPPPHRPSRQTDAPDSRAQRSLERRLQGAVPHW